MFYYILVLVLSICGLTYELLLATLSSYLIGNSILQFSLTIGLFLFGLGIGSFLSRFVKNPYKTFFFTEIILGVVAGFSSILIKFLYVYFFYYMIVFYILYFLIVIFIASLIGLEIPILGNIASEKQNQQDKFKDIISNVFTADYIGAIVATFVFPFLLLPWVGLTYTAILLGAFNIIIALLFIYEKSIKNYFLQNNVLKKYTIYWCILFFIYIFIGFFTKGIFDEFWNHFFYKEPVVFQKQSKYQQIVITKRGEDIRLFLDGHLQFLSLDEKRYHNGIWAIPYTFIKKGLKANNILILGGGDGLLARDIIQTFGEKDFKITLVDIDPEMTNTAKTNNILLNLNKGSLNNPNVKIINKDAFLYVSEVGKNADFQPFDIIIADFVDPKDVQSAKLYSKEFYMMIKNILSKDGIFVTQAGNAFFAKESFWCIKKTVQEVFEKDLNFKIVPYKVYIPSFGYWGFVAVLQKDMDLNDFYNIDFVSTKFDSDYIVDMANIQINSIEKPIIVNYFINGRKRFNM